jgi:hypoxanthine phosphoribosyltransferase
VTTRIGTADDEREVLAVRQLARPLFSAREVSTAIDAMALAIERRLAGKRPVLLAVMHGGVFTAVELCRRFGFPHEFDYVHATRYGSSTTGGRLEWQVRPKANLADRVVLVVDDILDRGVTLAAIQQALREIGVAELYTAALLVKRLVPSIERPPVDFSALTIDDVYVFGCGMDYKGYWRGLPDLYAVSQP